MLCLGLSLNAQNQNLSQTIRGTVIDKDSKIPLIGASITVLNTDPLLGTTTDLDGYFKIEKVPVGRQDIEVSYLGYEPIFLRSIMVSSGKELVLDLELTESTIQIETVVVKAKQNKSETLNEMATVSARSFTVEETSRYAASFYDPARMAQNYAGVSLGGGDDLSNEIIVRGNSPKGVMWRLEGIEIPNPNHFGALGSSGGAISMLSSSTLANSDFYTGAFPSEFGNATSGVFDLNMRNGNNEQREYAFMIGALGIEAAAEGPFASGKRGSYLVNYRYSTLSVLKAIGVNPVGDVLPDYQDLSFKVNLPTQKAGNFALFGLGGKNNAYFTPEKDSSLWGGTEFSEWGFSEKQLVGTVGLSHRILLSDKSYLRTVVAASSDQYEEEVYFLEPENNYDKKIDEIGNFNTQTYRLSSTYNHKFNARHTLRAGAILSLYDFNYLLESWDYELDDFETLFDNEGNTELYQAFAQWKYRLNEDWTLNTGVHYTLFGLNNNYSIEPRAALKWQFNTKQSVSASVGLHSKPETIAFYFSEVTLPGQERMAPNRDLEMMKSMHAVLGYDLQLSENMRLKLEGYYQYLYDVPVEDNPDSPYSIINANDIWDILRADEASNEGTGRNYGLDLTLERFLSNQYYFLVTGSLFDSKYTAANGREYNTRFNSNYQLNVLGGKEFNIGKKGNKILGVNLKALFVGGNRYTPIDVEASKVMGYTVRIEDQLLEAQGPDYFRLDLGLNYKINTKRMTHTILVDIQNLTNRENVFTLFYNADTEEIDAYTQTGFFPNFNYRIEF